VKLYSSCALIEFYFAGKGRKLKEKKQVPRIAKPALTKQGLEDWAANLDEGDRR
jgi:hypothetical protein